MWQTELELANLIFSISDHEFQVHPNLKATLNQLQAEGMIQQEHLSRPGKKRLTLEVAIALTNRYGIGSN